MMNIEVPPDLEGLIRDEIASGRCATPSEVLREALAVWSNLELRREVQAGLDQLDSGDYTDYDETTIRGFFDEIRAARPPRPR